MGIVLALLTFFLFITGGALRAWAERRTRLEARARLTPRRAMHTPNPPFGLFVDDGHAWVRLGDDGALRVGVDDFVTEAAGPFGAVTLPAPGTKVARGEPLVGLSVGGRSLVVSAPVDGEVASVNDAIVRDPSVVASDPYGLGWLLSLRTRDLKAAVAPLHLGRGGHGFLQRELDRLLELLDREPRGRDGTLGLVLADGGLPTAGTLATCSDETFTAFQRTFLDHRDRARTA